jgi:hypothetical protein
VALSQRVATAAFVAPILIALGGYLPKVGAFYDDHVVGPFDLTRTASSPWRPLLVILLLLVTLSMFMKQWSYYYRLGSGKRGFFVDTCGSLNDAEWTLDVVLSFWGGLLFVAASTMPSFWLPLAAAYSLLVALRCGVTLRRRAFSRKWQKLGAGAGPRAWTFWSTYPNSALPEAAERARFVSADSAGRANADIRILGESLDWIHPKAIHFDPTRERPMAAKEILAGWVPAGDPVDALRDQGPHRVPDLRRHPAVRQDIGDRGREAQAAIGRLQQDRAAIRTRVRLIKRGDEGRVEEVREQNSVWYCGVVQTQAPPVENQWLGTTEYPRGGVCVSTTSPFS